MLPSGVFAGAVLARKYRLLESLGKGGMGHVWRAQDVVLGAPIAVKVIDPDLLETHESKHEVVARFLHEAQAAAALRSPHVVQILEFGVDESGVPFMAMELLEGETLADRLAKVRIPPYADTARILTHVTRAAQKAHEVGIVHRDLKPANVFLTKNDDEELAKVMDFGIAKRVIGALADGGVDVTRTGRIVGTPAYMSPEQTVGNQPIDARSDLWALGVIAYECVVGKRPFEGASHGELTLQIVVNDLPVPSQSIRVPPGFDAWFARACDRDPERRFQSARELSEALRAVLLQPGLEPPDVPAFAAPPSVDTPRGLSTSRSFAPKRRGRPLVFGVILGCLIGLSVLGYYFILQDPGGGHVGEAVTGVSAAPRVVGAPRPSATGPSEPTASAPPISTAAASVEVEPSANPRRRPPQPATRFRPPRGEPSKDPRLGF